MDVRRDDGETERPGDHVQRRARLLDRRREEEPSRPRLSQGKLDLGQLPSWQWERVPGFQWRTDPALNLNWIWLEHYADNTPAGQESQMQLAHVVAARSYVGCLSEAPGGARCSEFTGPSQQ